MARRSKLSADPAPAHTTERPILVLQGGGALGAYQAGVYEALHEHGISPEWVAGVSIGAINAALIAGNLPEERVPRLRAFWEEVSSGLLWPAPPENWGPQVRSLFNEASAQWGASVGIPGFFRPRVPPPALQPPGTVGAISWYDTTPLATTLNRLIDFELLNTQDPVRKVRLSVGAVEVVKGNSQYFDTSDGACPTPLSANHIMASGALPPGFAPVEVDGAWYWDGGLVSNTPLQYVLDRAGRRDMLVFQVDLFSARGAMPTTLAEVAERGKDIQFASRTRMNTDVAAHSKRMGQAARNLLARLPPEFADDPDLRLLLEADTPAAVTIVHLIHRRKLFTTQSKDYEFSRATVREHWDAGRADVLRSLQDARWCDRRRPSQGGVRVFDLTKSASD
jgi:NTE family protein